MLPNLKISDRMLNYAIFCIFVIKIFLAGFFSSGYFTDIFFPFVNFFVIHFTDPWEYFFVHHASLAFPYPPLMLYLLTPFVYFVHVCHITSFFWINLIVKAPIYFVDGLVFYLLCLIRPQAKFLFVIVYLLSPIIFFAAYLQGQLDLIPVAFLLGAILLLLRGKIFIAAIVFAAALQCKSTAAVALPFLMIFVYRKYHWRALIYFFSLAVVVYLVASLPYILHTSYIATVFENPQQAFIFNSVYPIGDLRLYPVVLLLVAIISHFLLYKKINQDLLVSYLSLAFSIFLIFAYPVPSWFIWVIPYLAIFLSTPCKERWEFLWLYAAFCLIYIVFFLFFYRYPLDPATPNLILMGRPLIFNLALPATLYNVIFTLLAAMLVFQVYLNYRYSIRSNAIYKGKNHPVLIGISGDSGSGKSVFLEDIYALLGQSKVTYLEGDGEHRWERGDVNWAKHTHLDPKANLLHQQIDALIQLKQGLKIRRRDYDHETGKFTDAKLIRASDYVVIAGLHPFYLPKARKVIDIKIFLDTDEGLRLHWKLQRDSQKRGYSKEQVLQNIQQRAPDREKYITPQKHFADMCFRYFSSGDPENELKLQVILSANIDLEKIYFLLEQYETLSFNYDYSEDLHTQQIIFSGDIQAEALASVAQAAIENLEELMAEDILWHAGLRGIRQLILLAAISHHFKE